MALPQYVFDPVTQSYTLVQQPAGQMPSQSRGLYDLNPNGDAGPGPAVGPSLTMTDPGMAEFGVGMQNAALDMMAYGQNPLAPLGVAANVLGNVTMGITTSPSMMGMATPSPVANPTMPTETQLGSYGTPTAGLAGLSEAISEADETQDSNAGMAEAANAVAAAAAAAAANETAQTDAANAAAAAAGTPSGTGGSAAGGGDTSGGDGPSGDAAVSGAANEASHAADGNNSGESGGCFLTTAATKYMGQPDNGPVLNALRNFRDTYMRKDKEKSKDVNWYYTNAPRIMRELDKRRDAPEVYREMYKEYIYPAYQAIKKGNKVEAYTTYKALVNFAKRKSGIDNDELTPKPKHMANGGIASIAREGMNYQGGGYATPQPYIYNQPTMMAEGGLAAAKQTQDAGRGQDTMLVHMTPKEVAGLQSLAMAHGGSLTINPKTGLPEAGFLSAILPTLAGAALTVGSGGAINPYMAAGIVGGLTGISSGSLKKGLFAGLGAFGGANIGAGLTAAGAGTPANLVAPAAEAATVTPLEIAQTNIDPALLENMTAEQALNQGMAGSQTAQNAFANAANTVNAPGYTGPFAGGTTAADIAQARVLPGTVYPGAVPQPVVPEGIGANFEQAGRGFKNVFQFGPKGSEAQLTGEAARSAFGKEAGMGSFSSALAPIATAEPEPLPTRKSYIRPYDVNVTNRSAEMAGLYGPGSTSGREMLSYEFTPRPIYQAADGGLMDLKAGGTFDDEYGRDEFAAGGLTAFAEGKQVKKAKKIGGDPYYKFADSRKDKTMEAALDANFAKGGGPRYLNGEGDGMSDDIPAIIDGKQPARLADGEFVIPADVVSHLGNGSSKAGAKKLYSMMDRIRKARTGKKSQAPAVKSERYMPA